MVKTLQELLENSVREHHSKKSFGFAGEDALSYKEFGDQVESYSTILSSNHIKQGDKVAVLSANMPQWGISYFSVIMLGGVVVPLLNEFSSHEIRNILDHSGCKAIFVSAPYYAKHKEAFSGLHLIIEIETGEVLFSSEQAVVTHIVKPLAQPEDLAVIIYTSGTTGKSKGVMLSHKNLIAQLEMVSDLQPVNSDDVFLSLLPLSHVYEGSLGFLYAIKEGASVYYLRKSPTASVLLPALKQVKPTLILSVPLIIEKIFLKKVLPELTKNATLKFLYKVPIMRKVMHQKAGKKLYNTFGGRLRFFGVGGAKLSTDVERFLLEGKFPYAIGYGLTETAPLVAGTNPSIVHLNSTGPALKGVELKIHKPNPKTQEGEIWVRGDNVMMGYYNDQSLTEDVLTSDGWFKTGDIGCMDAKNRLFVRSRLKNVIIGANGENIYPEDIECVINSFRYVLESIVIEQKGKLVALVNFNKEDIEKHYKIIKESITHKVEVFKGGLDEVIENMKSDLIQYVNNRVSATSRISVIIAVSGDFDKTPTQKIKRYKYLQ